VSGEKEVDLLLVGGGGGGGGNTAFVMAGGGGAGGGFGSAFSDIFEDMFGGAGGGRGRSAARRGSDLQYTMEISLEEAYNGREAKIKIPVHENCDSCSGSGAEPGTSEETCPSCRGSGRMRAQQGFFTIERTCSTCGGAGKVIRTPCKKCQGQGRVRKDKTLKVQIPPGVDTGRRIRLSGEGEAGMRGGPNGDLYVMIVVKPHKFMKRDGNNLHCRVPIPMTTAALGGEIKAPTIEGTEARVKIPAGTQSGQQFRLKNKGMPELRGIGNNGDMYIEVRVETPVKLTKKQEDLLKELDKSLGGKSASKHSPESTGFFKKFKDVWDDLTE
jgi:molecular chaperone DnaJ